MITAEQFEAVCNGIETSSKGIGTICFELGTHKQNFYDYMRRTGKEAFDRYAHAKEVQADNIADDMIEIADDASNDYMKVVKGEVEYEIENKEVTNRSRLRIDTRKWLLSKLVPKKYGDKIDIEHSGTISIADKLREARERSKQR
jgi:hypothetical protein